MGGRSDAEITRELEAVPKLIDPVDMHNIGLNDIQAAL